MKELFCQEFLNKTNYSSNAEVCLEHLHCGVNFVTLISLEQLLFEFRLFSFKSASSKTAYTVGLVSKPWLTGWIQYFLLPSVQKGVNVSFSSQASRDGWILSYKLDPRYLFCFSQTRSMMSYFPVFHRLDPWGLTSLCVTDWIHDVLLPYVSQTGYMRSYFPVFHRLDPWGFTPLSVTSLIHDIFPVFDRLDPLGLTPLSVTSLIHDIFPVFHRLDTWCLPTLCITGWKKDVLLTSFPHGRWKSYFSSSQFDISNRLLVS